MKKSGRNSYHRALVLPVIMAVSFFLVFLGVRPPSVLNPSQPKMHNRAVIESQVKVAKVACVRAENEHYAAETVRFTDILAAVEFLPPIPFCEHLAYYHTVLPQLPSRAPPTFKA